jgi:hypothetical protein
MELVLYKATKRTCAFPFQLKAETDLASASFVLYALPILSYVTWIILITLGEECK